MPFIPYDSIISKIKKQTALSDADIEKLISEKLKEFSGLISKEGAAHIIANEQGISLVDLANEPFQIKDFKAGMRQITTTLKILKKYDPISFSKNGKNGTVASLLAADETGTTRITFWHDDVDKHAKIIEEKVYTFTECLVRENQKRLELHVTAKTTITESAKAIQPKEYADSPRQQQSAKEATISASIPGDIAKLSGIIVQITKPSFYLADKSTGKKVPQESFDETLHEKRYILNIILDDATDSLRCVFFGDLVLKLLKTTADNMVLLRTEEVFEKKRVELLGAQITLAGRIVKNDVSGRIECIAQSFEFDIQ